MKNSRSQESLRYVLIKAGLLFLLFNLLFTVGQPLQTIGRFSVYNHFVPGRMRFPYSDKPEASYSLSLNNLEAMFASHIVSEEKASNECRVFLIGDSSVWGFLLDHQDTLSAQLNRLEIHIQDDKKIVFYNLGYPTISLTKDLLILDQAMEYQPDLIIWLITLESFPYEKQLFTPLVQQNPGYVRPLINKYGLNLDPYDPALTEPDWWGRTIIGQRRPLADLLRLQLYAPLWAATGVDQYIPETYTPRAEDLEADELYYGLQPPAFSLDDLAFDVLEAGVAHAGNVPLILVNEPMFVSQGENSDIRYNFFYPRWVYDMYRQLMLSLAQEHNWQYIDLWQAVDNNEFSNSAIHLTAAGTTQLAEKLAPVIIKIMNIKQ